MNNDNKNKDLERLLELAQELNEVVGKILEEVNSQVTFEEVKQKTGISSWKPWRRRKLERLLETAPSSIVELAIEKYVFHYGKGGGNCPEALFSTVLENELLQDFDKAV